MKRILIIAALVLAVFLIIRSCGGDESTSGQGGGKVSSLYGTYVGTDNYGNTISITLKPDSDNEWRKFGEDNSSNLVYKDSKEELDPLMANPLNGLGILTLDMCKLII